MSKTVRTILEGMALEVGTGSFDSAIDLALSQIRGIVESCKNKDEIMEIFNDK